MGHINHKTLDVPRKEPASGADYTGDLKNCSTCPLGKSAQQPHPKQATYNVLRPFQLVSVDTLGPFTPKSLGGFKYSVKFVDQQTKWKKVVIDLLCVTPLRCSSRRPRHGIHERGVPSVLSRRRHQAEVCLSEHPSTFRSERACRPDFEHLALFSRRLDTSELPLGGADEYGRLPEQPDSSRSFANGIPYKALYGKDPYLGHFRVIGSRAFVHEEIHTNKLEHRAWEGRLVGFSGESKSYRIYNSETRRVRVSQNVIFIEAPSVVPSLDARDFDDGEFTYDDHDDMLRDVRNYTSNHSADSVSPERAVGDAVGDLSAIKRLEKNCETTNRDLGVAPAGSASANDAPGTSGSTPEEDSPAPPGGVSPPVPVNDASSPGSSPGPAPPLGSSPAGSAPSGTAPQGGFVRGRGSSRGGRGSAPTPAVTRSASRGGSAPGGITQRGGRGSGSARGRGTRGGRGSTSTPATTRSASSVPTAKTISELHRLSYAFTVKGEFPDVAHRDGTFGFTEYAYTAGTTQPNVPRTIKEALPGHRGVPDVCFPSV